MDSLPYVMNAQQILETPFNIILMILDSIDLLQITAGMYFKGNETVKEDLPSWGCKKLKLRHLL